MDKKGNPAAREEWAPQITLFGKRMKLRGPEPEQPPLPVRPTKAKRGEVDAEERRVFWLAVGVFTAVLLAAFLGNQFFRPKDTVPVDPPLGPRAGPRVSPPVDPPLDLMTQPLAETVAPEPEASGGATAVPPQPTAATTAAEDTPAKARAAAPPPPTKARARRRPERDDAYLRRLRDEMQQYERENAQGKDQEPPQ